VSVWDAPEGRGPYGITATPDGTIYYASLASDHMAHIDTRTVKAEVIEPPTPDQGAKTATWRSWRLPGEQPQA
jgi:virginiamycin B lyase